MLGYKKRLTKKRSKNKVMEIIIENKRRNKNKEKEKITMTTILLTIFLHHLKESNLFIIQSLEHQVKPSNVEVQFMIKHLIRILIGMDKRPLLVIAYMER